MYKGGKILVHCVPSFYKCIYFCISLLLGKIGGDFQHLTTTWKLTIFGHARFQSDGNDMLFLLPIEITDINHRLAQLFPRCADSKENFLRLSAVLMHNA